MERELWRWHAVELAAAIRTRKVSSREAVHSVLERADAAEVIEAQRGLPTPIDPVG